MAVVEGMDRKSEAYLKYFEDEFVRRKMQDKGKDPELDDPEGAEAKGKSRIADRVEFLTRHHRAIR